MYCHPVLPSNLQSDVYRILLGISETRKAERLTAAGSSSSSFTNSFLIFTLSQTLNWTSFAIFLRITHWIQTFRPGSSNGFNHTSTIISLQGQSHRFFCGHHDSKWFSNEIVKQQHCLLTTANVWTLYLVSRFYGKSYSCQWRTTQNKYPKASEARANKNHSLFYSFHT